MKRAQPHIVAAPLVQLHIPGDDVHDVIAGTHLLYDIIGI
jgi:hypothetical protein